MGSMFVHLGLIGLLALLCFLAALAGAVSWLAGWRWRWLAHGVVVLALVACASAELSVWRAWRAPIDDRVEQAAEQARLQQVHTEVSQQVRRGRMFAEDSVEDALDVAGMDQRQAQRVQHQVGEAQQYAYRSRGVQQRDVPTSGDALEAVLDIHAVTGDGFEYDVPRGAMTWEQKQRAIDRTTTLRNWTWVIVLLTLAVGGMDYLGRLGRPLAPLWPLPLDGRWVFRLWARPMTLQWRRQQQATLEDLLRDLVRRGQTFCLFSLQDPFAGGSDNLLGNEKMPCREGEAPAEPLDAIRHPFQGMARVKPRPPIRESALPPKNCQPLADQPGLYRLTLGPLRLGALPCIAPGHQSHDDEVQLTDEDLLESLWFGRCATVVTDAQAQARLLEKWQHFLAHRERTRAWAARTVHIVWDLPEPMGAAALAALASLGPRANVSLIEVVADAEPPVQSDDNQP